MLEALIFILIPGTWFYLGSISLPIGAAAALIYYFRKEETPRRSWLGFIALSTLMSYPGKPEPSSGISFNLRWNAPLNGYRYFFQPNSVKSAKIIQQITQTIEGPEFFGHLKEFCSSQDKALKAELSMKFTSSFSGQLKATIERDPTQDKDFINCVEQQLQKVNFSKIDKVRFANFNLPLSFTLNRVFNEKDPAYLAAYEKFKVEFEEKELGLKLTDCMEFFPAGPVDTEVPSQFSYNNEGVITEIQTKHENTAVRDCIRSRLVLAKFSVYPRLAGLEVTVNIKLQREKAQ